MTQSLVAGCAALADDTRWSLLVRLGRSPASASTLATELPISRQAIAKHLDVLRGAGLVEAERDGRQVVFRAVGTRLSALARDLDTIARGWETRLDAIKRAAEAKARTT
ncbi:MAG TPA: metalloregulator ArsR/SmtB family transcription factor [Propionibacteriaceae bacterium]